MSQATALQCWHPTWIPDLVLAAPVLVQLPLGIWGRKICLCDSQINKYWKKIYMEENCKITTWNSWQIWRKWNKRWDCETGWSKAGRKHGCVHWGSGWALRQSWSPGRGNRATVTQDANSWGRAEGAVWNFCYVQTGLKGKVYEGRKTKQ